MMDEYNKIDIVITIFLVCFILGIASIFASLTYGAYQMKYNCVEYEDACYKFVGSGGIIGGVTRVEIDCSSANVEEREKRCSKTG